MSVAVQQPLDFAPVELRAHGLRDAHSFPLVGSRTAEGVRSWRMPASPQTWGYPLVEWSRTGNSYAPLGFDCDSREAVELGAACAMGSGDLPTPNVFATRKASGHAQVCRRRRACWASSQTQAASSLPGVHDAQLRRRDARRPN